MEKRSPALEAALRRHLGEGPAIYAFQEVDSTMEAAHELAGQGVASGTLVFAARQTKGRGRLGRTWSSPEGGLYCSLILRPTRPAAEIPQLSLVAGLAVAEAIRELTGLFPTIRWPNDVLINEKKVAGILTETRSSSHSLNAERSTLYAIVGIGINVMTRREELPDTATSLTAQGASCDPSHVTGFLYRCCMAWYDVWQREGFAPIREALRSWIGLFGQLVNVTMGQRRADSVERIEGQALDVDEQGRLLIRLDSGLVRAFDAGEISLLR